MIQHLTRSEFERDVTRAKSALEDAVGHAVLGYRAPTFSIMRETLWSLEVLCEAGFRYDSSIFPIVHDRYGIPDAPRFPHRLKAPNGCELAEFPMSTVTLLGRRAAGGGRRLLPAHALFPHPARAPPDQPARGTAGHGLSPSVGAGPRISHDYRWAR